MSIIYETWELIQPFYELGIRAFDFLLVGLIILWIYRLTKGYICYPCILRITCYLSDLEGCDLRRHAHFR